MSVKIIKGTSQSLTPFITFTSEKALLDADALQIILSEAVAEWVRQDEIARGFECGVR